ncbi:MAG: hypothetical protein ACAH89_10110 [Rariglobus sp.]|nr:hypothetical protein [Rariglobus sp.]
MNFSFSKLIAGLLMASLVLFAACSRKSEAAADAKPAKHEHHPPHGGTPVVLGDEVYHVELVLDPVAGKLQAYVLDGELENFIRSASASFEVTATVGGETKTLVFAPVANVATGETAGDTSLFEVQADWLKTTREFDAVLNEITVRGTVFKEVKFNYPKGNDEDTH